MTNTSTHLESVGEAPRAIPAAVPPPPSVLTLSDRRWLHDKYQRLDQIEGQFGDNRSTYIAAVTTALFAAMVYAVVNLLPKGSLILATTVSFLAAFGVVISTVWAVVARRTTEAQNLWREAALQLEDLAPPIEASLTVLIPIRGDRVVSADLTRPYHVHRARFTGEGIPFLDRIRPSELSSDVPLLLVGVWAGVLVVVWMWFFLAG